MNQALQRRQQNCRGIGASNNRRRNLGTERNSNALRLKRRRTLPFFEGQRGSDNRRLTLPKTASLFRVFFLGLKQICLPLGELHVAEGLR